MYAVLRIDRLFQYNNKEWNNNENHQVYGNQRIQVIPTE